MEAAPGDRTEAVWKALADPTRRALLDALRDGPRTTGDLVLTIGGMTRYGVMKHLGVLESAGLVVSRREGRVRWNHLNAVPLRQVYERWVGRYEDRWAGAVVNLKRLAERPAGRKAAVGHKLTSEPARVAVVETAIEIAATPQAVFDHFFDRTKDWFYESDERRQDRRTVIERRVGGKMSIVHHNGDENMMAWVTLIKEGREVRLRGDFTAREAFVANVTIKFEAGPAGCKVAITHRMCGEFPDSMPGDFEEGWHDGLEKLKALCET